jgi:hypothetical protein
LAEDAIALTEEIIGLIVAPIRENSLDWWRKVVRVLPHALCPICPSPFTFDGFIGKLHPDVSTERLADKTMFVSARGGEKITRAASTWRLP